MLPSRLHVKYVPLFLLLLSCVSPALNAQVVLNPNQTAMALAQKLAGPGITVSNASLTCSAQGNGFFNGIGSNLGLDSGIVLTTGRAQTSGSSYGVNGPASALADVQLGLPGDAQLNAVAGLNNSFDACKLEFDLVPKGDTIQFDYVFGSEEYTNSVCAQYNDAFAFFISGPGISGAQNIALVPGTNIPVAVNSVNNGIPGIYSPGIAQCQAMGPGSPFTSFYVDNAAGTTVTYRGFTTVLKAVKAVTPCSTYHLKLVIADALNGRYDSGVFIRAGSLKTNSFSIAAEGNPATPFPYIVKGCTPGKFIFKRSQPRPAIQVLKYIIAGTAVNGTDYSTIADSVIIPANDTVGFVNINGLPTIPAGQQSLKLYLVSPYGCNGVEIIDSATLLIEDAMQASIQTPDTAVCEGKEFRIRVSGSNDYTYEWSPVTGLDNASLKEPLATPEIPMQYILKISWPGSGCLPVFDTFRVSVTPKPSVDAGADVTLCSGDSVRLYATVSPQHAAYQYQWNGPDGFTANTDEIRITEVKEKAAGWYMITVLSDDCPPVKDSVSVTVTRTPGAPEVTTPVFFCVNGTEDYLTPGGSNYIWYPDNTTDTGSVQPPKIPTGAERTYVFYVSEVNRGCEGVRAPVHVIVEKCCEDFLFIPTAFTPNDDGRNDRFRVMKGNADKIVLFEIFNRWGQLVFKSNGTDFWDGTVNGTPAETGSYYYQLIIGCNRGNLLERKGEVTLIR